MHAVERERSAVDALRRLAARRESKPGAQIVPVHADFTGPLALPPLDGALLANALHYVPSREQRDVLGRVAGQLRPGGRIVLVEYQGRAPNRWVPYPIDLEHFREIALSLGFSPPVRAGTRRSAFGGTMYAAYVDVVDPR